MRSRVASAIVSSLLALPLVLAACGHSDEEEAFDTLADCYEDHHGEEGLTVEQAIVVCCIDHPIAGVHPSCGATAPACVTHVTAELDDVVAADVEAACDTYIEEKSSTARPGASPSVSRG